jgi:hypothetical protein
VKRLAIAAVAVLVLAVGAVSASAANGGMTETRHVSFVLSSDTCPNLAEGTVVEGSGIETSTTVVRTDHHGITTITNSTRTEGTATDQHGNTYTFLYLNSFRVSNTLDDPGVFSGPMFDSFTLSGHGPANLANGFVAIFTTDFDTLVSFEPIHSFGDPIDFATGEARCDPL